jgi:cell wall-associated NlpC family hydrolase
VLEANSMMKKIALHIVSVALSLTASTISFAEPPNFSQAKTQLLAYADSGQYDRDITSEMQKAQLLLQQAVKNNTAKKKLAIVLDIDETALSNLKKIRALYNIAGGFGGSISKQQLNTINETKTCPAIQATLNLYKYAIKNNVSVFFVSERRDTDRNITIRNLRQVGYTKWAHLYTRQPNQYNTPTASYKTDIRKNIVKQKYDIVLNIGDQGSDLTGGFADNIIKLPNPFYQSAPVPAATTTSTKATTKPTTTTTKTKAKKTTPSQNKIAKHNSAIMKVIDTAYAQLGKPYRYAATGPDEFDCSGLTKYCYAKIGIYLPHKAFKQVHAGIRVAYNDLKPGDLIFFREAEHVGIYIGQGKYIHAPQTGESVRISTLSSRNDYYSACRPLPLG